MACTARLHACTKVHVWCALRCTTDTATKAESLWADEQESGAWVIDSKKFVISFLLFLDKLDKLNVNDRIIWFSGHQTQWFRWQSATGLLSLLSYLWYHFILLALLQLITFSHTGENNKNVMLLDNNKLDYQTRMRLLFWRHQTAYFLPH